MFQPIKVADMDLGAHAAPLTGLNGYTAARCLVRLHGVPVGSLDLAIDADPADANPCAAQAVRAAALEQLAWPLLRQHLIQFVSGAPKPGRWRLPDVFAARPAGKEAWPCTAALPSMTVAVCTRDRPEDLARCLEAIGRQDYPALDVLVVDNAPSSDATERLVRERFPKVRYVREPRPGLDWARNRAILEARGEVVAYTDDDVVVDGGWARALGTLFGENAGVMAATGLVLPLELESEPQLLFELYGGFGRGFERQFYGVDVPGGQLTTPQHGGSGKFGTGANMAFRRRLFDQIGFFDPALDVGTVTNGGGDLEMFFRVLKGGYVLAYEPRALVRHRHRPDYPRLHAQLANNGVGFYAYLARTFLAYPEERAAALCLGIWWFFRWSVRRLAGSFLGRSKLPRDLILAELIGSLRGSLRYGRARRAALALARADDPPSAPARPPQTPAHAQPGGVAVRRVDLDLPLAPLSDVTAYPAVRVMVFRGGAPLGALEIANLYQAVSASRLAEALVDHFGVGLLDRPAGMSQWAFYELCLAELRDYHGATQVGTRPEARLPDDVPVSVVLATYDRPDDLRACLHGLTDQASPRPLEIIVVDNHPLSGLSAPVVAEFPGVRLVNEPRQGLSRARNAGIAASHGAVVVATDDDVVVPENWIERLVAPFARPEVMIVTGNVLALELETPSQRLFEQYGGLGRGFEKREVGPAWFRSFRRRGVPTWELGATANAAFRAEIFRDPRIGPMDEALGAGTPSGCSEDTYTFYKALRAGHTLVYEPAAYVWHKHRRDPAALRRQLYNYSKGHVAYHLLTFFQDHDIRGLLHVVAVLPALRLRQLAAQLLAAPRGTEYPLSLLLLEIGGNLAGPWALLRSFLAVRSQRRRAPERPQPVPELALAQERR